MISITKIAISKLVKIADKNNVSRFLFSVSGGGCNGFKYDLKPTNKIEKGEEFEICRY